MIFVILLVASFYAMNMGSTSFATSFAAAYGGRVLSNKRSTVLFILFVILGAVLFGKNVSVTLGEGLVVSEFIDNKAILIIFISAGISMFAANFLHVPQSTSLVAVAAICGVGAYYNRLNFDTLLYLIPFWIILPVISYFVTLGITYLIYPPRNQNFWIYERLINHEEKLKVFVIVASCYNAFSVGTNNVANVVGPILSVSKQPITVFLLFFGLMYGAGALIFSKTLKIVSKEIVPLGLMTASIISFVSGSLMIIASYFGVPQSFVMLQMGAIFAVSCLKEGAELTFKSPLMRRTLYAWTINPILTFLLSFGLSWLMLTK